MDEMPDSQILKQLQDIRERQAQTDSSVVRLDTEVGQIVAAVTRIENKLSDSSRTNWAPLSLATTIIIAFIAGLSWMQTRESIHLREITMAGDGNAMSAINRLVTAVEANTSTIELIQRDKFRRSDWQYEKGQIDGELSDIKKKIDDHQDGHPHSVIAQVKAVKGAAERNAGSIDQLRDRIDRLLSK